MTEFRRKSNKKRDKKLIEKLKLMKTCSTTRPSTTNSNTQRAGPKAEDWDHASRLQREATHGFRESSIPAALKIVCAQTAPAGAGGCPSYYRTTRRSRRVENCV
jgi:hypothetical protein